MSVGCFVQAAAAQQGSSPGGLVTTITWGEVEVLHTGWSPHVWIKGYDGGSDWWGWGPDDVGSIGNDTYDDNTATSRTVTSCYHDSYDGPYAIVQFTLDTASIADSDDAFVSIEIDGVGYDRSAATTYVADNGDGGTTWYWSDTSDAFAGGATVDFSVHLT